MLVSGVYFSVLKFNHPGSFKPLHQASKKGGKPEDNVSETGKPKSPVAGAITDAQLAALIPLEYVEVIHHNVPVFNDTQARGLHLSDAFRQALFERLNDINFQPCSLFNLRSAQYTQRAEDIVRPIEHCHLLLTSPLRHQPGIQFLGGMSRSQGRQLF